MSSFDDEYPVAWRVIGYLVTCSNLLAMVLCLFVFQALLRNSSIRQNAYNIYIIFLIFPDALQNIIAVPWNFFGRTYPQGYYEIGCFVWFFFFASNFYLNTIVAYEINKLATASHRRQKTAPPKLERAWKQVVSVYIFSMLIAMWDVLPYKWSPIDIDDGIHGSLRFGSPNDGVFSPMVGLIIQWGLLGTPITYVMYIGIRIAWYRLLPTRGRTRVLSLFFMRIIIVFLLFYLPNTIVTSSLFFALADNPAASFWIGKVTAPLMNALQAVVTLHMVLLKDDVREAVASDWNSTFGYCCCKMAGTNPQRPPAEADATIKTIDPTAEMKTSEWDEEDVYSEIQFDPECNQSVVFDSNEKGLEMSEQTRQEESGDLNSDRPPNPDSNSLESNQIDVYDCAEKGGEMSEQTNQKQQSFEVLEESVGVTWC